MVDRETFDALCRQKLNVYTARSIREVEPSIDYKHNWHVDCVAEHLQAVWDKDIKRLIINIPPRSLKTHAAAVAFPTWGFIQDPSIKFMLTSFKFELAKKMTRRSRMVMQSDWYRKLAPHVEISGDQNEKHYFETTGKGHYYSAAMSSVTGEGADIVICFPKGTCVLTNNGIRCISEIRTNDTVWTYNHDTKKPELRAVKKIFCRPCSEIVEVQTIDGYRVLCTPEHPFWVGKQGYKQAKALEFGDEIIQGGLQQDKDFLVYNELCLLQKRVQKEKGRLHQSPSFCEQGILLLEQMLKDTPQLQKQKTLRSLRRKDRDKIEKILFFMQEELSKGCSPECIQESVSIYQAINSIQRQLLLFRLWEEKKADCSPHRRKREKQQPREPNSDVPIVSHKGAPELYTGKIESVKEFGKGEVIVYDFTVEGNSNFFAEGILVHNCDDPLNPDEAASPVQRQNCIDTIRGTLFSRFNDEENGRFILIMQRLNADDPTGELLKDDGWTHLKLPAEAINKSYSYSINGKSWELKEGDLLFPERLSREVLDKKLKEMGSYNYSGQMLQEPTPIGGGMFKTDWINWYASKQFDVKQCNIYILVDPSTGDDNAIKNDLDYTGMAVWALAPDQNYYLIDGVKDRLNPTERVNKLFELHRKWNGRTGKPPKVGYETIGFKSDKHFIERKMQLENYRFALKELPPKGEKRLSKTKKVERLVPLFESGQIWLPNDLFYLDENNLQRNLISDIIEQEYLLFPFAPHDDFMDAMSMIFDVDPVFPRIGSVNTTSGLDCGYEGVSVFDI